jgi:hypothetical protein
MSSHPAILPSIGLLLEAIWEMSVSIMIEHGIMWRLNVPIDVEKDACVNFAAIPMICRCGRFTLPACVAAAYT